MKKVNGIKIGLVGMLLSSLSVSVFCAEELPPPTKISLNKLIKATISSPIKPKDGPRRNIQPSYVDFTSLSTTQTQ